MMITSEFSTDVKLAKRRIRVRCLGIGVLVTVSIVLILVGQWQLHRGQRVSLNWHPYSAKELNRCLQERRVVIVFVNADWTPNSQSMLKTINERSVRHAIHTRSVCLFWADYTKPDGNQEVADFVHKTSRKSMVPLIAIFSKMPPHAPTVLLDLTNARAVIQAIAAADKESSRTP